MLKKLRPLLITLLALLTLTACSGKSKKAEPVTIAIPVEAKPDNEDYQSITKQLEDAGFTNVKTQKIEDLIMGWLTKDGEVEKITVKGQEDFEKGDLIEQNAPITVHYHTFKEKTAEEKAKDKEYEKTIKEAEEKVAKELKELEEKATKELKEAEKEQQTETKEPEVKAETAKTEDKPKSEPKPEAAKPATITIENNADFAYITSHEKESKGKEFGEKYKDKIVEFDGHIIYMVAYDSNNVGYDFLLATGDWIDEDHTDYRGIYMKFNNVPLDNPAFQTSDGLYQGKPVHVKAKVTGSAKLGQLIFLEPIELTDR